MNFDEYQQKTAETAEYPSVGGKRYIYPLLGLLGESGEVAEKIKKVVRDGDGQISDGKRMELKKELGDVLWYLARLSAELDLSLEDVARTNIEKLSSRKDRGVLHGDGDSR